MKILFVSQWFEPEPTFRGEAFVRDFVKEGFEVEVVTGFPNYPGGKIYDGYQIRPIKKTKEKDFELTRLALYPSHSTSSIGRILNYMSFFFSAFIYLTFFSKKADLVYVYHPPLTVGLAAALAKVFRRWPVVIEIQDLWPDTLKATGMLNNDRILKFVGWAAFRLYKQVDHIIVQSWGFKDKIEALGINKEKITTVINWSKELKVDPKIKVPVNTFDKKHKFRIMFAGNMGKAQALDTILDAALLTKDKQPKIGYYFVGEGIEKSRLVSKANDMGLDNVVFLTRVSEKMVASYYQMADVLLVHLRDHPLFAITIPSKTQTYMSAGKPIIIGARGDAAKLIEMSNCGYVVPPENPKKLAEAVVDFTELTSRKRKELGENSKRYYNDLISKKIGLGKYFSIFHELIKNNNK